MDSTQEQTTEETIQDRTADYVEKKGLLHLIPAVAAAERLEWEAERQMRMIDAEDRAAAEAMGWNLPEADDEEQGEAMKQTVLGDLHTTINQAVPEKAKGMFGKLLTTGLLGAGLGVGGALLSNHLSDNSGKDTDTNTTIEVGLGKIEDYLKQE